MPEHMRESKADRIGEVVARSHKRLDPADAADLERFLLTIFDRVPAEDVLARSAESLYGAAVGLWKFPSVEHRRDLRDRRSCGGRSKSRVFHQFLEVPI